MAPASHFLWFDLKTFNRETTWDTPNNILKYKKEFKLYYKYYYYYSFK